MYDALVTLDNLGRWMIVNPSINNKDAAKSISISVSFPLTGFPRHLDLRVMSRRDAGSAFQIRTNSKLTSKNDFLR